MAREAFEEIVENFELFDDWEDRYRYVIDLGKEMDALPDDRKTDAAKVEGCASQVWLVPDLRPGDDGVDRLHFQGDSDAMIVRGLIALLHALASGEKVADVAATDFSAELGRLGLESHLSAQRSNGLKSMIGRLKDLAGAGQGA